MTSIIRTTATLGAGVLGAAALALTSPLPASAGTSCQGGSSTGHCVVTSNESVSTSVVDTVPLSNNSGIAGDFTCTFTSTVSESLTTTASVDASVSAQILGAASASVSVGLSQSIQQTGSQATAAGVTVRLEPGQTVQCQRTYQHVVALVHEYDYSQSGTSNERDYTATIPSSFGVALG